MKQGTTKVGRHRGNPRLWLEGQWLIRAGFVPGQRYRISPRPSAGLVVIEAVADGPRTISGKRSGAVAVLDINSAADLAPLADCARAKYTAADGRIVLTPAE